MKCVCNSYTTVNNLHFMNYWIGLLRSHSINKPLFFIAIELFKIMKDIEIISSTLSWRKSLSNKNQICSANQWTGFYMIGTSVMKELNEANRYELRNCTDFTIPTVNSVRNGLKSSSYLGAKIWETLPLDIKQTKSRTIHRSCVKKTYLKTFQNLLDRTCARVSF